jgi:hypothetical protein
MIDNLSREDPSMNTARASRICSLACFALALTIGCSQGPKEKAAPKPPGKAKAAPDEHVHGPGPHGGTIGDWGGGKYHFEFTVDHPKKEARVYILGGDETTPVPIKAKDGQLTLSIKGAQTKDAFEVTLKADPQKGDPEGKASSFVGTHDKLGVEQEFEGTLSGEADGTPYRGDFKEEPAEPKKT